MPRTPKDDKEVLALLESSLLSDALYSDAYPIEQVDEDLRGAGLDPDQVGKRGAELASQLLKKRRLAWQDKARMTLERRSTNTRLSHRREPLSRAAMLQQLNMLRSNPELGAPVATAFRNRKPSDASDEDLRSILEDVELLRELTKADDTDE